MKGKSVKSGIVKVAVIGLLVMVSCLVFYYVMQVFQQKEIAQLARYDRNILVNRILEVYSAKYSSIINDNSAWDELIENIVEQRNDDWLEHNIGYMIENYQTDAAIVFDSLGNVFYEKLSEKSQGKQLFPFGEKISQDVFNGKPFADFYLKIGQEIYEYHGAGIVSAADIHSRQEKPVGYLFLVKQISNDLLNQYKEAIGKTEVGLVCSQQELTDTEKNVYPNYLIVKELKDYTGENIAYMYFVFKNSLVKMFKNFIPIFVLISLMCVLIVLAIVRYTNIKVSKPLQNIATAFNSQKTDMILPLKKEENEFGVISGMIEEFFEQKNNLQRLNTEILQSREEIMVQNETLFQQKEEILVQNETLHQQKEEISAINEDLAAQKHTLEHANRQLTAGITYASRLQSAMLQAVAPTNEIFDNFFTIYYPKDIVGGDFYFTKRNGDCVIAALGDCTGHGVPGAMLASMGISFLTQLFNTYQSEDVMPNMILDLLKQKVTSALGLDKDGEQRSDGMDIALVMYNKKTRNGYFSGAQRPMILIRDNEIFTIKGDNIPIGHFTKEGKFTAININLQKNDKIYLFSDGCTDQTGGEKKRRLMIQNFRTALLEISALEFSKQKQAIEKLIFDYKGELPQTDDISLLAFEIL